MARSKKKSVEVILSSDDEESDELNMKNPDDPESDEDDDDDEENLHIPGPAPRAMPTPPATTKKRKWGQKEKEQGEQNFYLPCIQCLIGPFAVPETPIEITYMLTLTSVAELKKTVSKRKTKSANIRLNSDEPFDTFKAQVLVKISHALKPRTENIANYEIRCTINRVISKPGMDVESEEDYAMMVESALKSKSPHIVNICVEEIEGVAGANKENEQNEDSDDNETGKKKKKKVRVCHVIPLQHLNLIMLCYRSNHLSMLQTTRRWRTSESFAKSGLARSQDLLVGALTALLILKPTHIFYLVTSTLMLGGWPWWDFEGSRSNIWPLSQSLSDEPKWLSHPTSTTKQQAIRSFPNHAHISRCTTSKGRTSRHCFIILWSTGFQYISRQRLRKPLSSRSPTHTRTSPSPSPSSSVTSAYNRTNIFKLASTVQRAWNRHGSLWVLHPVQPQWWNSHQAHKKRLHTYPDLALCPDRWPQRNRIHVGRSCGNERCGWAMGCSVALVKWLQY